MKKRKFVSSILFTLALCAVVLSGCGAGMSKTTNTAAKAETAVAMGAMPMEASEEITWEETEQDTTSPGSSAAYDSELESGITSPGSVEAIPTSRKLIRNMDLNIETTDFDNLLSTIGESVSALGGYIEQSSVSGNSMYSNRDYNRHASLTARIPADQLDSFVFEVSEQGNVINRSENVRDVTLKYSDIESHKKSLTIEQERLWELLEKAESVDAIIALESRLSEIRYQLESYESQLRTYDNQVDYSTVNLFIDEVKVFTPTSPDGIGTRIQKGLQRNLENVGDGFVNFVVWFVTSLPVFAVLAVIIGCGVFVGRVIFKKALKIRQKKEENNQT